MESVNEVIAGLISPDSHGFCAESFPDPLRPENSDSLLLKILSPIKDIPLWGMLLVISQQLCYIHLLVIYPNKRAPFSLSYNINDIFIKFDLRLYCIYHPFFHICFVTPMPCMILELVKFNFIF